MNNSSKARAATFAGSRLQAYSLLVLGILFLLGALLLRLNPFAYPIGVFLFGFGLLLSAAFNPYRLLIGGILLSTLGIAVFFAFTRYIPYGGSTLILAIGVALIALAYAARRGYIGQGAITPGIIVVLVGFIEYPPATHLLPGGYAAFLLSLWFPAIGLLVLGVVYLLLSVRR